MSFIELKILGFTTTKHVDWEPTWPLPNMFVFAHVFMSQLRGFVPEILVRSDSVVTISSKFIISCQGIIIQKTTLPWSPKRWFIISGGSESSFAFDTRGSLCRICEVSRSAGLFLTETAGRWLPAVLVTTGPNFEAIPAIPKTGEFLELRMIWVTWEEMECREKCSSVPIIGFGAWKVSKVGNPKSDGYLFGERLTMGGVVKDLILQGFASLYMSWCSYEVAILHVKQNISKYAKSRCNHEKNQVLCYSSSFLRLVWGKTWFSTIELSGV